MASGNHLLLCDKGFDIAKNAKYDGYQYGFASIFILKRGTGRAITQTSYYKI